MNSEDHFDLTMNNDYQNLKMGRGQRRTLFLPSGEAVWDLSGNVGEWVKGELNSYKYYHYDNDDRATEISRFTEWAGPQADQLIACRQGKRYLALRVSICMARGQINIMAWDMRRLKSI
ncbi:MAG: hypothetical protein IPK68_23070 [Bdellovibrionales bacterium]|nr:hypothetical protein [Bdellovibrionales bacterium]